MKNSTVKTIIKALANAPTIAAGQALKEIHDPTEKETARRIFKALNIDPEQTKKTE